MKQKKITKEWINSNYPHLEVINVSTHQLQIRNKKHGTSYLQLELLPSFELLQGKLKMPGIAFIFERGAYDDAKKTGIVTIESMWKDDDAIDDAVFCEWDVWIKEALGKLNRA